MQKPLLTKEQVTFWICRFSDITVTKQEHRQRLINSFVNSVYLYDDRLIITFNYKDGSKTVSLANILRSDLTRFGAPSRGRFTPFFYWYMVIVDLRKMIKEAGCYLTIQIALRRNKTHILQLRLMRILLYMMYRIRDQQANLYNSILVTKLPLLPSFFVYLSLA